MSFLSYTITSVPNPILASVGGANPTIVTLQIMINNHGDKITMSKIEIDIPKGAGSAQLSTADFEQPVVVQMPPNVSISAKGGLITVDDSGDSGFDMLGSAIIFRIPNIVINNEAGAVMLKITEFLQSGSKNIDSSKSIVKLPANYPVTSFTATPPTIYDLKQNIVLNWTTSDQGKLLNYSLHSADWQPDSCAKGGTCYTWQDGVQGVSAPDVSRTTTFALDILDANRKIIDTVFVTVPLFVPEIYSLSYVEKKIGGLVVRLHWLVFNAGRIEIELNGNVIVQTTMMDTYTNGFPIDLTTVAGKTNTLTMTAFSAQSGAKTTHFFSLVNSLLDYKGFPVNTWLVDAAYTPDGSKAFVLLRSGNNNIAVVDVKTKSFNILPGSYGANPQRMALSPDGNTLIVFNGDPSYGATCTYYVFSVNGTTTTLITSVVLNNTIECNQLSFTPDGKKVVMHLRENQQVFSYNGYPHFLRYIDVANNYQTEGAKTAIGIENAGGSFAFIQDGKYALVTSINGGLLKVNIATKNIDIVYGLGSARGIGITNDGRYAVIGRHYQGHAILDLQSWGFAYINEGDFPFEFIPLPGVHSFIANCQDYTHLQLISPDRGGAIVGTFQPRNIEMLRMSPDGNTALGLYNSTGGSKVTLMFTPV